MRAYIEDPSLPQYTVEGVLRGPTVRLAAHWRSSVRLAAHSRQASDLLGARRRAVHLPIRAQRHHLAVVVGLVGEHAFRGDLVIARRDEDVPDVGFLVAALIGVAEEELDLVTTKEV